MSNLIVSAVMHDIERKVKPTDDYIGKTVEIISKAIAGETVSFHHDGDLPSAEDPIIRLAGIYEIPYVILGRRVVLNPSEELKSIGE